MEQYGGWETRAPRDATTPIASGELCRWQWLQGLHVGEALPEAAGDEEWTDFAPVVSLMIESAYGTGERSVDILGGACVAARARAAGVRSQ